MESLNSSADKKSATGESKSMLAEQDDRSTYAFWSRWVKSAWDNKNAKRHRKESQAAWDEYEKNQPDTTGAADNYDRCNPAYYAACKTLEPAYYARTPKTAAKRREGVDDPPARLAGRLAKMLGNYLVDACEFDECFSKVTQEFINADKVTTQICYDADTETQRVELAEGQQPGEGVELVEDPETGEQYYTKKRATNQRIYPKPVISGELIHTPSAKLWSEITEIGYKFVLSKDEALARFEKLSTVGVNWKKGKSSSDDEARDTDSDQLGDFIEGWEVYCYKSKTTYWLSPSCCPGYLLDTKPDEWNLRNYFPSPRAIIGSCPRTHLYPTPLYVQLSGTIKQMHVQYAKIFQLVDGIRRRALIDGSCPELLKAFSDLEDNEFILVENLAKIVEAAKGVQNLVWYLPVQELVSAIGELTNLDGFFSNKFDLYFGVPDILKGASDPLATATSDSIAAGAAHDRFEYQKKQIRKLASDTIEMMIDLALKVFDDEKLAQIWRVKFMSDSDKQHLMAAVEILKNDEERVIRIDVESDSMSFVNEQQDTAKRNAIASALIGGMKEIGGMLEAGQVDFAAIALDALIETLTGLGGDEFIEDLRSRTEALIEKAMNPPDPGPPPPDYEQMKLQVAQAKVQVDQSKVELENMKLQVNSQMAQMNAVAEQQAEGFKLSLQQQKQEFEQFIQQQYLAIEAQKFGIEAQNKAADNERLNVEAQAKLIAAAKPEAQPAPASPAAIIINAPAPSPVPEVPDALDILTGKV